MQGIIIDIQSLTYLVFATPYACRSDQLKPIKPVESTGVVLVLNVRLCRWQARLAIIGSKLAAAERDADPLKREVTHLKALLATHIYVQAQGGAGQGSNQGQGSGRGQQVQWEPEVGV